MSFNAFTGVTLSGHKLTVDGFSDEDLGEDAQIQVSIAAKDDGHFRCQKAVPAAAVSPWSVEFKDTCTNDEAPPTKHTFKVGEEVYLAGCARSESYDDLFLWGGAFTIT